MPTTSEQIKVRACSIFCTDHPEWGTWGVFEDKGYFFEIHGARGGRVLHKSEANQFWQMARFGMAKAPKARNASRFLIIAEDAESFTLFDDKAGSFNRNKTDVQVMA